MIKRCEVCGREWEAKRTRAKYCSARCRQRAHRGVGTVTVLSRPASEGRLASSTRRRLEDAGRADSELGVATLLLAERLDQMADADTGGGIAALMKEYRVTLAEAVKDADDNRDALDDIREAAALKLIRGA